MQIVSIVLLYALNNPSVIRSVKLDEDKIRRRLAKFENEFGSVKYQPVTPFLIFVIKGEDCGLIIIWNVLPVVNEKYEIDENIPKMLCQMDEHTGENLFVDHPFPYIHGIPDIFMFYIH